MLLFFAIAAGLVAIYLLVQTVRPLVESGVITAAEWQRVEDESLHLLERRDQLLAELQELEFEAALHKIDARDLEALRRRYELEAVELDKRIDARREQYDGRIDAQVQQTLDAAAARRAARDGGGEATEPAEPATAEAASEAAEPAAEPIAAKPAAAEPAAAKPAAAKPAAAKPAAAKPAAPVAQPAAPSEDDPAAGAARVLASGEVWTGPAPCAACGNSMAPDSAFCDGCGAPVLRACAGCGSPNRAQARFCKACGNPVDGEVS